MMLSQDTCFDDCTDCNRFENTAQNRRMALRIFITLILSQNPTTLYRPCRAIPA